MNALYIIEARDTAGNLVLNCPQPESVFGILAIKGIHPDTMAKVIYAKDANVVLSGSPQDLVSRNSEIGT